MGQRIQGLPRREEDRWRRSVTKLAPEQIARIRKVREDAREGRATLAALGAAHDLCESANLTACAGELRGYMREKLDPKHRSAGRELVLGVVSGIITHHVLRGI